MGNRNSNSGNELLKRSSVKLQAQKIVAYDGNSLKWHTWNKKTKAAIGTAGLLRILESESYAESNKMDNETIFHLLQVATADGHAAHLVDKFEDEKNGYAAYQELVKWFEGDELTTETAEDIRAKMDRTNLSTKNSASQYINQFLQHKKHLEELHEEYTPSKTINIFLTQISDPDYATTIENCLENKLNIDECIERIRAKERRLDRQRGSGRKLPLIVRRVQGSEQNNDEPKTIRLEDYKTEKGYLSVPSDIWPELSDEDKSHVKSHNGKLRRDRGDEGYQPRKRHRTIQPRRNRSEDYDDQDEEKKESNKVRSVQFKEKDSEIENTNEDYKSTDENGERNIIQRRGALRFKFKGGN